MLETSEKAHLVRLLEAVAQVMGFTDGRLELVFEDGHLSRWYSHSERRAPRELDRFDAEAAHLLRDGPLAGDRGEI